MGLLDEAIRDHLELKRRTGADPSELARAEREALEPVFPGEPLPEHQHEEAGAGFEDHAEGALAADAPAPEAEDQIVAGIGEETAELDMQAVLEQDARLAEASERHPGEPPPEPLPGQERLSFE
jgi:hypothetical protein